MEAQGTPDTSRFITVSQRPRLPKEAFINIPQATVTPTWQGPPLLLLSCKEKNSLDYLLQSMFTLQMFIEHLL